MDAIQEEKQQAAADKFFPLDTHRREVKGTPSGTRGLWLIETEFISGSNQPRKRIDPESLSDLAASIAEKGILTPLMVRFDPLFPDKNRYKIIFGERRFQAAKLAGLTEVPCFIKDVGEDAGWELALVENIQRVDLSPLEEANAVAELQRRRKWSTSQLCQALGRNPGWVRNRLAAAEVKEDVKPLLEYADGMSAAILIDTVPDTARIRPEPDSPVMSFRHYLVDKAIGGASYKEIERDINEHTGKTRPAHKPPQRKTEASEQPVPTFITPLERGNLVKEKLFTAKLSLDSVLSLLNEGIIEPSQSGDVWAELESIESRCRQIREARMAEQMRLAG